MIAEHIIYSAALAILVGMVFYRSTGRDPSWIILVCAWAPDLDEIANPLLRRLGIRLLLDGSPIQLGTFHNIAFMVIFGIAVAFLLDPLGIKFFDALLFSMIGFLAHLFEDAPVYNPGSMFFWPFSFRSFRSGVASQCDFRRKLCQGFFLACKHRSLNRRSAGIAYRNHYPYVCRGILNLVQVV
jgi:hypothetical protein